MNNPQTDTMNNETNYSPSTDGTPPPEGYLTKVEVAQRMKKCARTIENLMAKGLPHYKIGRAVIFRWSEVEAHLAANYRVAKG